MLLVTFVRKKKKERKNERKRALFVFPIAKKISAFERLTNNLANKGKICHILSTENMLDDGLLEQVLYLFSSISEWLALTPLFG